MRPHHYPSDITDAQWALIEPHIPPVHPGGRPRKTDVRDVLDAILYILRTGCQWRYYPGNQDPHKSLQPIRSSNSRSRLPRDQRSTTESTEIHGKENPNQLPLSVSFPGATPARRVGSFRGYALVMIFLAGVIFVTSSAGGTRPTICGLCQLKNSSISFGRSSCLDCLGVTEPAWPLHWGR